jgi:hypothetical protein
MANCAASKERGRQARFTTPANLTMNKKCFCIFALLAFLAIAQEPKSTPSRAGENKVHTIDVHISGEINKPQTLILPKGSLLQDAIKAAGGITPGGTHARIHVIQNKSYLSANLQKGNNPALLHEAYVMIDSIILSEWPPDQRVSVSGTKPIPYEKLKKKLEPELKGEWVMNLWKGHRTLDLRMGAGKQYRNFSILLIPPEQRTIDPETQKQTIYTISVHPRQPRGTEWEKDKLTQTIIKLVETACND